MLRNSVADTFYGGFTASKIRRRIRRSAAAEGCSCNDVLRRATYNIHLPSFGKLARLLLAFSYSNQTCYVRWKNVVSSGFHMGNGTRQGGVLSPLLFSIYIRDLLGAVTSSGVGCFIGDQCVNILAYADDMVLLAPSWHALQLLLNILHVQYSSVHLTCNVKKSVCMCFLPKNRQRIFSTTFPLFKVGNSDLQFVPQ